MRVSTGYESTVDVDACVDLLADEEARNDYLALFRNFTIRVLHQLAELHLGVLSVEELKPRA